MESFVLFSDLVPITAPTSGTSPLKLLILKFLARCVCGNNYCRFLSCWHEGCSRLVHRSALFLWRTFFVIIFVLGSRCSGNFCFPCCGVPLSSTIEILLLPILLTMTSLPLNRTAVRSLTSCPLQVFNRHVQMLLVLETLFVLGRGLIFWKDLMSTSMRSSLMR